MVDYDRSEVSGEYPTGTVVLFTCNDQYMRTGSLSATCEESGSLECWSSYVWQR